MSLVMEEQSGHAGANVGPREANDSEYIRRLLYYRLPWQGCHHPLASNLPSPTLYTDG